MSFYLCWQYFVHKSSFKNLPGNQKQKERIQRNAPFLLLSVCSVDPHDPVFSPHTGVKGNIQGNLFKIITQSDTHYFIQAPTHQDKMDWIEAIREQT